MTEVTSQAIQKVEERKAWQEESWDDSQ